jgi:hypothetical protein
MKKNSSNRPIMPDDFCQISLVPCVVSSFSLANEFSCQELRVAHASYQKLHPSLLRVRGCKRPCEGMRPQTG